MTLSTISMHLDHTERCEARTLLAARIAGLHCSHLMGIVPTGVPAECATKPARAYTEEAADIRVETSLYLRRRADPF